MAVVVVEIDFYTDYALYWDCLSSFALSLGEG
jgi:hypothetical protein